MEEERKNVVFVKKMKEDGDGTEYYEVLDDVGATGTVVKEGKEEETEKEIPKADFVDRKSVRGLIILGVLIVFGIYCSISGRTHPAEPEPIDMKEMLETFRDESGIAILDSAIRLSAAKDSLAVNDSLKTDTEKK